MLAFGRIWNRLYTICITPLKEKIYHYGPINLKYLFFKKKSEVLVVGFQACHKDGARYNYISTLKGFNVNRLYIKDDFAENHRGNYYLGCNGEYNVEKATMALIETYVKRTNAKKVIFIGSSKGGYAAVNFGISFPGAIMIIAAPQYHLGNYLNCEYQMPNLRDILGEDITQEKIEKLNMRLKNKILNDMDGKTQKVFIHYSQNDHTYEDHIKDMLRDLQEVSVSINCDVKDYTVHGDLKYYYPDYLRKSLRTVLECG